MHPSLSIIICAFNAARTIRRCLDSIPPALGDGRNIEVILVDDASTDGTASIACGRPGLKYLRNDVNIGPGASRNRGIRDAEGDWILFCDADDWYAQDALTTVGHALEKAQEDLLYFDFLMHTRSGVLKNVQPLSTSLLLDFLEDRIISVTWNKIYRRSLILEREVQFPPLRQGEDAIFNLEYILSAGMHRKIDGFLYNFDKMGESLTRTPFTMRNFAAVQEVIAGMRKTMQGRGADFSGALAVRKFRFLFKDPLFRMARDYRAGLLDPAVLHGVASGIRMEKLGMTRLWGRLKPLESLIYIVFLASPPLAVRLAALQFR